MGIHADIYAKPNELALAIPFEKDGLHYHYDKEQIHLFWQALVRIETVFYPVQGKI